jgi:hypothetical protein
MMMRRIHRSRLPANQHRHQTPNAIDGQHFHRDPGQAGFCPFAFARQY